MSAPTIDLRTASEHNRRTIGPHDDRSCGGRCAFPAREAAGSAERRNDRNAGSASTCEQTGRHPSSDIVVVDLCRADWARTGPTGAQGTRPLSGLPGRALNDRHWGALRTCEFGMNERLLPGSGQSALNGRLWVLRNEGHLGSYGLIVGDVSVDSDARRLSAGDRGRDFRSGGEHLPARTRPVPPSHR
jgi:hypothetical protein